MTTSWSEIVYHQVKNQWKVVSQVPYIKLIERPQHHIEKLDCKGLNINSEIDLNNTQKMKAIENNS